MRPRIRHQAASPADARSAPAGPGKLARWREQRLLRVGVEAELAASIASDCAIDLHALIGLVERGCPPELAARIVAPLDHERSPC